MGPSIVTTSRAALGIAFVACLQLFPGTAAAAPVSQERAEIVAANWMWLRTGIAHEAVPDMSLTSTTETPSPTPTYYHVLNMSPNGWAIVAADDVAYPIVAYSVNGNVYSDDAPPAFRAWMGSVNESIGNAARQGARDGQALRVLVDETAETISDAWQYLEDSDFAPQMQSAEVGDSMATAVAPLLTTTWSQGLYYNQFCPADSGGPDGHALVGCCATAVGQILRFHGHPETGAGTHSYSHPVYGTLSASFGTTAYNWAAMPASGRLNAYNSAAATLLSHVGIALDMNYGPSGSGCYPSAIAPALRSYFRYLADDIASRSSFTDAAWIGKIKTDIDAGRPVLYAGYGSGGHAFVLDGYNDADYFHFNWGWNGAYDGYFLITNLNPAGYTFTNSQMAVFGIRPADSGPTAPAAPSALSPTVVSASQINLTWQDNSTDESGFAIERKVGASGAWSQIATVSANARSFNSTGLNASTAYSYRVFAYNAGGASGYSNEATASTPALTCSSYLGAIAIGGTASGALASSDCTSTVRTGRFYYDTLTFPATAGRTYTIALRSSAFDTYLYLLDSSGGVLAQNDDFSGTDSQVVYKATANGTLKIHATSYSMGATGAYTVTLADTTPPPIPTAPTTLTATLASASSITLRWADTSTVESGFLIERKVGSAGAWVRIAAVGANVVAFNNTGLAAGTTYGYRVRAYNGGGSSAYSNEAAASTPGGSCSSGTTAIAAGSTASGTLATTDCVSTVRAGGYFYDTFTFAATAGRTYTIDLRSSAFDAYLYLLDSSGRVLAQNDDYSGLNSRIVYKATASGTLKLHTTSYAVGATGAYSVVLSGN